MIGRIVRLLYGVIAYLVFLTSLLYAAGFVGNVLVPKSIDSPSMAATAVSWLVDVALLGAFAIQHSVMARPAFKRWWTQSVPRSIERSSYVLISSLLLFLLFWQWRPLNDVIWQLQGTLAIAAWTLFALGWLFVVASSFMIDHFDLFGLRQTWLHFVGRDYSPPEFRAPCAYRYVRHPIMLGFVIAFWASPTMTVGHLLFAVVTTAYIFVAVWLEERDLVGFYGDVYRAYQQRTGQLLPRPSRRRKS
jgi:protein-S-isoprenylcysteine O-methyltransferase Ste14